MGFSLKLFKLAGGQLFLQWATREVSLAQVRVQEWDGKWISIEESAHYRYAVHRATCNSCVDCEALLKYRTYRRDQFPHESEDFHGAVTTGFDEIIYTANQGERQQKIIGFFRDEVFFVTDGFHRCAAAAAAGHLSILASRSVPIRPMVTKSVPVLRLRRLAIRAARCLIGKLGAQVTLTCAGKTDGGGAQVHAVVSVAALCKYFGFQFQHTPLARVEHHSEYGLSGSKNYAKRWEGLIAEFNFDAREGDFQEATSAWAVMARVLISRGKNCRFALEDAHAVTNFIPEAIADLVEHLSRASPGGSGPITVVVHVRRGDVGPTGPNAFRFTSNERVLSCIQAVSNFYAPTPIDVKIVTQSPDSETRKRD